MRGEQLYPVPPLALPDVSPLPPLERLTQYEAVRLFIARAREVQPTFAVTNATAPAVAEICARLDGLPLAIELAATRVRLFPPPALLTQLEHRLGVLTGGARDLPERQRTLRATLDWSYSLLTEEEQRLFARLSVFVGGQTLEAIEAVCNREGTLDVLGGLDSLLEKSLLSQDRMGDETRFVMLETLHEYARERLEASGELEGSRHRHALFFLALVKAAEQGLTGPEQSLWLERLEREHGNLRAALAWTQSSPEIDVGLRTAAALQRFWWWHGHWSEGRRWLERLLAMVENNTSAVAPKVHAGALRALASLSFFQAQSEADLTRASVLAEQALALYRAIHDLEGVARTLTVVANVASEQGDLSRAEILYTEALALVRDLGNRSGIASVLTNLAHLAVERKDFARASALYEDSETLFRILGDTEGLAHAVEALAELDYLQSDFTQATQRYAHSLAIAGSVGDRWMSPICVAGLGPVARSTGRRSHATRLLGAAAGMWTALGVEVNLRPPMVAEYHAALAALRAELGDEAFTTAWTEGENMTLEQAIAYATSTATP